MNGFEDILGNEQIIKTLKSSVLSGRVSHAYLFCGASGSGKSMLANAFAKYVFCETKAAGCKCHSCSQFDSGNHSDLFYVSLGDKEKSLGVERIRVEVVDELSKKPFEYSRKFFIINDAETLTVGAQNALLRSIEDPPAYAVIILLAKNPDFLPTVLSRCFIYKMERFGSDFIYDNLKSLSFPENESKIACACAESLGNAAALCRDSEFFEMRKQIYDILAILNDGGLVRLLKETPKLEAYKERAGDFTELALIWFRDVLAYKATGDFSLVTQGDYREQIARSARLSSFKSVYGKINGMFSFAESLAANAQFAAALDALAIRLAE